MGAALLSRSSEMWTLSAMTALPVASLLAMPVSVWQTAPAAVSSPL